MYKKIVPLICGFIVCYANDRSSVNITDTKTSYSYIKVSDQWLIFPGIGYGYRTHSQNQGLNLDLSVYSYYDLGYSIYGKCHYLYYPKRHNFYLGVGAGLIGGRTKGICFMAMVGSSPPITFIKPTGEGLIGVEWNTNKAPLFIQLEIGASYGMIPIYPGISFGIGF